MEKQAKYQDKILKFLPRAASAVTFHQNLPFSPNRESSTKFKSHGGRGFSGPILSMIPDEARRKPKNGSYETQDQEPTSPKISCMGQIKHKKNKIKKRVSGPKIQEPKAVTSSPRDVKKHALSIRRMFSGSKPERKSDACPDDHVNIKPTIPDRAPSLSQMKRFASGREKFSSFDWSAQVTPVDAHQGISPYSDTDREGSDLEDEDVKISFSAPLTVGGGPVCLQPRKEINLWKRRTMAPPRPLQLRTGSAN
ncbi:hypothetical protein UlMin_034013 [Ulmus minor]